jgi:putative CocE/NonD family hydrolase
MVTGWDDIFLPWMMRDYAVLAGKGRAPELTIGPWSHATSEQMATSTNEAIAFLGRQFLDRPAREAPVRIFLRGEEQWHDLPSWPPPGTAPQAFYLQPTGGLGTALPLGSAAPTRYRYDPADPTPAVGGPSLEPKPVPRDNTEVERRGDVITFTGEALKEAIDVTGEPIATIAVRSDRPSFDLFVRICDVGPDDISMTVCDGIRRVGSIGTLHTDPPADDTGVRSVEIPLWPTAHRFLAGHRIRIQISSGAHPRYARNPGSGEPGATATELHVATQEIFHDAEHTSSVLLPIWHH